MKVKGRGFGKDKKIIKKKKNALGPARKRFCRFCADKMGAIDYKDIKRLEVFMTEKGKIVSSRFSGNCAKHQRRIRELINKARFLSLLPYTR
ncbi:MAG: 30S ribosomal protein S18 [Candidatus Omnitrophica bacterium]|jgi:small subunit ribosomal protein S18|nr:30S ribosomal protein S18 [Candidatus Omnitrophota bacterium]MDD5501584.1 30S ribosomal protein S18 [Candidatus Omnitrophota bacterium]